MIRVRTPSRLHFGLLALPTNAAAWRNQEGDAVLPRRHFGGAGLMIDRPGVELTVSPAKTFGAEGPLAERALQVATTYCANVGIPDAFHIRVESAAPEHVGLGTGTQFCLAVARAIAELTEREHHAPHLAMRIGRGKRSAIGLHGFERGGFLVEGGKTAPNQVSPVVARCDFPADWQIVLVWPQALRGRHGIQEREAFAHLERQESTDHLTDAMSRIVLLGMLPALHERDLSVFGEALHDYNRRAGEMFRGVQGGVYADPWIESTVRILRSSGAKAVGQSSWGPAVFAVVAAGQLSELCDWLTTKIERVQILVTSACNRGATVQRIES